MKRRTAMRRSGFSVFLAGVMMITTTGICELVSDSTKATAMVENYNETPVLQLRYDEPATSWDREAVPLGNGSIGAMPYGGVDSERIMVNEQTIWSGGPQGGEDYDGGDNDLSAEEVHESLQYVRQKLQDMINDFRENKAAHIDSDGNIVANDIPDLAGGNSEFRAHLNNLAGEKDYFGQYQTLGEIYLNDPDSSNSTDYSNYMRVTDIGKAVQTISYEKNDIEYTREYFISNPANVMVSKFTASEEGSISRNIYVSSMHGKKNIISDANEATITMEGYPTLSGDSSKKEQANGVKFVEHIKIIAEGGTISQGSNHTLQVKNADSIVMIMSAGTNYQSDPTEGYNYLSDEDAVYDRVVSKVDAAAEKGYDTLLSEHLADYKNLYNRCVLNLGATDVPDKMTDDLLHEYNGYNTDEENKYLETLFFQYGRYLLISSSRENSLLPANLQGIWEGGAGLWWNTDFHTNINLQMNYWPSELTDLSECHQPLLKYIDDMVEKGKVTAQKYYCKQDGSDVRGWVLHHECNAWGNTSPSINSNPFYFPAAAAWQCQDFWEAYQFNSDKELLAKYYDTMLGAALFWVDNLWEDTDGTLVSNPSYSPEHYNYTVGAVCDQSIIWELFDEVISASEVLGKSNDSEIQEIIEAQEKLYMPDGKTIGGQLSEWKDETYFEINNPDKHRHQNHLYLLYPGTYLQIGRSEADDILAEAAKVTLERREIGGKDGMESWSKAWKTNMYARLHDGESAYKVFTEQLRWADPAQSGTSKQQYGSTSNNLFSTQNSPFQIDGNFGATAGICEMLVQSQNEYIEPLAALPSAWSEGSFSGIKARGNFSLGIDWSDEKADKITVKSNSGNDCGIKYNNISECFVTDITENKLVNPTVVDKDTIKFPTVEGNTYVISKTSLVSVVPTQRPAATPATLTQNNNDNTAQVNCINLAKPVIKSVKCKNKKLNIVLKKKVSATTGYTVRYSLKKNMKSSVKFTVKSSKLKKGKIIAKVLKKLKKGKKYYVQVNAYKKVNKVKYYSKWSAKKRVIVK